MLRLSVPYPYQCWRKAVQVLLDDELVLVPFSYYDRDELAWVDGVQIVDLRTTHLAERGEVIHRGLVRLRGRFR